ncbi:MAG: bifunctional folylpolyglutamate synthase/dihydrofolate synthase [Planctomycetota bacterium]|nr:bifunctional folylpolyglutamate synthase/dihydrofolate synthase [Planctomycetota bacterium]
METLETCLQRLNGRINWEKRLRKGAMRVDLAPMVDLMERLGNPHRSWRAVHVAGTKGKGSVARLVAAGLMGAGYSVGVYASPHVEHMRERIRIDFDWVSDAALTKALGRVLDVRDEAEKAGTDAAEATWFDLVTATGFLCFAQAGVDWAVVEVGLGGRLDSTNVVHGELCVIPSIELEHTDILGSTHREIALEKAGILKVGSVLALGVPVDPSRGVDADAGSAIAGVALAHGVYWETVAPEGSFAQRNLELAAKGLDLLSRRGHFRLSGSLLTPAAVHSARLPGRAEKCSHGGLTVVLDGAHVPSSVHGVLQQCGADGLPDRAPQVVLGLGQDKDAPGILKALSGAVDRVHCTSVEGSLHRDPVELAHEAREFDLEAQVHDQPLEALEAAVQAAKPDGWVLVIGSLHLVGAVRSQLKCPDPSAKNHE